MSLSVRRLTAAAITLLAALAGSATVAGPAHAGPLEPTFASAQSPENSEAVKNHRVYCPRGTVILNGGAYVFGPGTVHLDTLRPDPSGAFYEARASQAPGTPTTKWSLGVYGICSPRPPGLQYMPPVASPTAVGTSHGVGAQCPAGKAVIGMGARASVESGRNVHLQWMLPAPHFDLVHVLAAAGEGGEKKAWTTEAYAVCAFPVAGAEVVRAASATDPTGVKIVGIDCKGKTLFGIGGWASTTLPADTWLLGMYPGQSLTGGTVIATEDPTGAGAAWETEAWGMCV